MNQELPGVQVGFRKGRGSRDEIVNIHWITEQARESQKSIYFCFKAFDYMDHNKLWRILKEMGIPDHITCLLRYMYASQESTEPDMEQWIGLNLGKEHGKGLYIITLSNELICRLHHEKF